MDNNADNSAQEMQLYLILNYQGKKQKCLLKSRHFCSQALVLLALFGRRDWTRTNDPHHVKVVL